ncbi:MAG TPA: aldo/keto reductase [Devosia sp.]|nr:aldo/keto reductase [Devosia sp.]
MQYTRLGNTGLEISRLCVGCMSFGEPDRGGHNWTLPEADSRPIMRTAWDAGINFFDTANVYSDGTSEEIVGKILKEFGPRDSYVLATKVNGEMRPGPNGRGLSRKAIMWQIDESLKRLGTDYVDLYQIHRFDPNTPVEETLEALHDVVKAGKARYLGASSMWAWQFSKLLHTQKQNGWAKFVSMQDHLNLLMREEEREMIPLCIDQGVGLIPWSPMARGQLTRPWGEMTIRAGSDNYGKTVYSANDAANQAINEAVATVANARGVPMARVALAWVLQKKPVAAPIVGATKISHITDAVAAVDFVLAPDEIAALEAPYRPASNVF